MAVQKLFYLQFEKLLMFSSCAQSLLLRLMLQILEIFFGIFSTPSVSSCSTCVLRIEIDSSKIEDKPMFIILEYSNFDISFKKQRIIITTIDIDNF